MKELFNILSSVSNFMNEKRFIFAEVLPPTPEKPKNAATKVEAGKKTPDKAVADAKLAGRRLQDTVTVKGDVTRIDFKDHDVYKSEREANKMAKYMPKVETESTKLASNPKRQPPKKGLKQ